MVHLSIFLNAPKRERREEENQWHTDRYTEWTRNGQNSVGRISWFFSIFSVIIKEEEESRHFRYFSYVAARQPWNVRCDATCTKEDKKIRRPQNRETLPMASNFFWGGFLFRLNSSSSSSPCDVFRFPRSALFTGFVFRFSQSRAIVVIRPEGEDVSKAGRDIIFLVWWEIKSRITVLDSFWELQPLALYQLQQQQQQQPWLPGLGPGRPLLPSASL